MAMKVKMDECIDCGACVEPCPNDAIFQGDEQYEYLGKWYPALSERYYVVPEKCSECVGFYDEPQCVSNCPVDCILKDPERSESKEALLEKKQKLHGA